MRKYNHEWEDRYIDPSLNGVTHGYDKDGNPTQEFRKYFDPWTRFQQCIHCHRVEAIDYDAVTMEGPRKEWYRYDGWFVVYAGELNVCEYEPTIGYYKFWDKRRKTKEVIDEAYFGYGPEIMADLVIHDVLKYHDEERPKRKFNHKTSTWEEVE